MKSYQDMLRSIMDSSGWSQQQLAVKLGVSFPTVNYWLNDKVTPRPNMQKRIRNLYIARDIPYEGPVFITLKLSDNSIKVGDTIAIYKTPNDESEKYELFGIKQENPESEPPTDPKQPLENTIKVINSPERLAKGTKPGFRIYDRVNPGAFARIMFILHDSAIAVVEDWGIAC